MRCFYGSKSWLDHCIVSPLAWSCVSYVYILKDVYSSDHKPLVVDFDLGSIALNRVECNLSIPGDAKRIRWGNRSGVEIDRYKCLCSKNLVSLDWESLRHLSTCDRCTDSSHIVLIDDFYSKFISILQNAAAKGRNIKMTKHKPVPGWNEHVKSAHQEARVRYFAWLGAGAPSSGPLFEDMKVSRSIFKSRLKWCQKNESQILLNNISKACSDKKFHQFWRESGKLSKSRLGAPDSIDGVSDPKVIAENFKNRFQVAATSTGRTGGLGCAGCSDTLLTHEITYIDEQSVFSTIRNMALGKAVGHDHLGAEHLRFGGPWVVAFLSVFVNACIRHSHLPTELTKSVVSPIIKSKTTSASDGANYRPISVATACSKVIDSILLGLLSEHVNISDAQFGFKKHSSTDMAIFSLKEIVSYYTARQTKVYACFLDLSRAFDRVEFDILWRKLRKSGVPSDVVGLLQSWYRCQVNVVRWQDSCSGEFVLPCGVRQGGLTSPLLFNLYVNSLIEELNGTGVGCSIAQKSMNNLSYADDMVLLSPSVSAMRVLLEKCEKYAAAHNLLYNTDKSVAMVFGGRKHEVQELPLYLNDKILQYVDSFKYLGHVLSRNLHDELDMDRERRSLAVRANMLAGKFRGCSGDAKTLLFKTYCTALYTPQLWARHKVETYRTLKVQYNDCFRIMFQQPRWCSASTMFAEARVPALDALIRHRVARFRDALFKSSNTMITTIISHCFSFLKHWSEMLRCKFS